MCDILKPGFSDSSTERIQTFKLLSQFKCKEILLKFIIIHISPLLAAQTEMVRVCIIVNQDEVPFWRKVSGLASLMEHASKL